MIIDAWIQHPTLRLMAHPMFETLRRWNRLPVPTTELPVAATLVALQQGGVSRALTTAWSSPGGDLISNDEVAAFVADADGMLAGVGSVDLRRPLAAMREVRRCVEELGFKAIRVLPWLWELPPGDRRYYPVYAACAELGVPFCLQIGHTGPLMPSDPGRPMHLDPVLLDFPELTVVGGHIGYPWTEEAIALATKYENFHIDTSAYTVRRYPAALVEFMRAHGRTKVLFGSNYPMIMPGKALEGLESLGLDDEARALFLAGNAARVYKL